MGEEDYSINDILEAANEIKGTSDIHLKVGIPPYFRINGNLEEIDAPRLSKDSLKDIAKSILIKNQQVKLGEEGDVDISFKLKKDESVLSRYRVHICKDDNGYSVDMRIVPDNIIPIESIGFPYEAVWKDIVNQKEGLILVTGKTGSGKTTTMASLIQRINETRGEHIVTIEDPIEYVYHPNMSIITQREVGSSVISFEKGLEGALRQDPNVILIGEIRDKETAYIALEAAGTGHLVFSTLHTMNAIDSVRQYVKFFSKEEQENVRTTLASSLNYVLSQQLIPYQAEVGRSLAMEIMNVRDSDAIKSLLRDGKEHQIMTHLQTGQKYGMITMDDSLKNLHHEGRISLDDLKTYSHNPKDLVIN